MTQQKEIKKTKNLKFNDTYYNIIDDVIKNEINIRIGGRGLGKTFSGYRYIIDDFLKNKNKFVIIRRQQTTVDTLLSDIINYYDIEISFENDKLTSITTIFINNEIAGFLLSLSCCTKYKSHYFDVTTILFDEFIKSDTEKRVSKDEAFSFFEMLETITRDRIDVTCILLSNAVKMSNDYFKMWNVLQSEFKLNELTQINDVVNIKQLASTVEYFNRKKKTLTYKATENTKYFDYAYKNEFDKGNLNYYIKENKSKILPSKNDYYFNIDNNFYWCSDNYISLIDLNKIPCNANVFSDNQFFIRNTILFDRISLINDISNKLNDKIMYNKIYFSSMAVAVNLCKYIFGEEV